MSCNPRLQDFATNNLSVSNSISTPSLKTCFAQIRNLQVDTINGEPVSSSGSGCLCSSGTYLPNITNIVGFSSGVGIFAPFTYIILDNVVKVSGILVATNTGGNNYSSADIELPFPASLSPLGSSTGTVTYWNGDTGITAVIISGIVLGSSQTTATLRFSTALPTDGPITIQFTYVQN